MPLNVLPPPNRRIVISCDGAACTKQITDEQATAAGGLLEAGWLRRFNEGEHRNEYFCPDHKEEHSGN